MGLTVRETAKGCNVLQAGLLSLRIGVPTFTLGLLWNLILTHPETTSQAQVKMILSLSTLSTHAMDERKQDMLALRMAKIIMMGKEDKKV